MTGAQAREETGAGGADPGGEREGRDGGVFLTVAVGRLARELTVQADREMSGLNVTVTRYTVLEALVTARALSAAEVARAVGLTPQTVSPVIREMARCEWVTRSLGGLRGRGVLLAVTPRGLRVYREARARLAEMEERFAGTFGERAGTLAAWCGELVELVGLPERGVCPSCGAAAVE